MDGMALSDDIMASLGVWNSFGWNQGSLRERDGLGHCAVAAAEFAVETGIPGEGRRRYNAVVRALNAEVKALGYPHPSIIALNDDPATTFAVMVAVFTAAAKRAREHERALQRGKQRQALTA